MLVSLVVLLMLLETPFGSSVDHALSSVQARNWAAAEEALNRALIEDPTSFDANNLHYLRGRVAEEQHDWSRALDEFVRIGPKNPLRPLATWHAAYAAIQLGVNSHAEQLIDELPGDFPANLRIQLVRSASPELALKIVNGMSTRQARLQRALLQGNTAELWVLLRDRNSDDVALECARQLVQLASSPREWRDIAGAFLAHREFEAATSAYLRLAEDPKSVAEARYQLGRVRFLSEDYLGAIETYRSVASDFPGTDWEKDAEYQVGTSFWRLRDYPQAEAAYLHYIEHYKAQGPPDGAIRDLVDIYRSMGENAKALSLIEQSLAGRLSTASRQALLFTKAKILIVQERYANALQVIRQLKGVRLQATPNGTTADEVLYFEALCLDKTGNSAGAQAIWRRLAEAPDTYYGHRAAEQLGQENGLASRMTPCEGEPNPALAGILGRLESRRRPSLEDGSTPSATDVVSELLFLNLWDEASLWTDSVRRPDASLAADLGYVSGRFNRAITYADRMGPTTPEARALFYPEGFRDPICRAAAQFGVDPLWLHAIIWQESKYDPNAHSSAAARGLMQFIPDTAEAIAPEAGVKDLTLDQLYDPEISIQLGAYYWSLLLSEFKSPELALAAYNAGPDNVRRWQDKWPASGGEFFVSDIGFTETKRYVQAVFGARAAYGRAN